MTHKHSVCSGRSLVYTWQIARSKIYEILRRCSLQTYFANKVSMKNVSTIKRQAAFWLFTAPDLTRLQVSGSRFPVQSPTRFQSHLVGPSFSFVATLVRVKIDGISSNACPSRHPVSSVHSIVRSKMSKNDTKFYFQSFPQFLLRIDYRPSNQTDESPQATV